LLTAKIADSEQTRFDALHFGRGKSPHDPAVFPQSTHSRRFDPNRILRRGIFMVRRLTACVGAFIVAVTLFSGSVVGDQPGWSPVVIATGAYRQQLQQTPITQRPNRPLHFYGNTVRRRYHRGPILDLSTMRPNVAIFQRSGGR
jgi:hypothetical protein